MPLRLCRHATSRAYRPCGGDISCADLQHPHIIVHSRREGPNAEYGLYCRPEDGRPNRPCPTCRH